jgi:hypothetical protein
MGVVIVGFALLICFVAGGIGALVGMVRIMRVD